MRSVLCLLACLTALPAHAEPIPPSPPEQIPLFKLPPGFEIQLVVSDPDIGQPMNLNFDVQGRLWVTHSIEYPFPAKGPGVEPRPAKFAGSGENEPRDRLTVVTGIGPDGKPQSVHHFVGGLNIPIGQTPIGDGSTALVYGIPSIFRCRDKDGDGQADDVTTLYTRFGNVDVHGNASSFSRWVDGWIYGCHGFSNASEIRDGSGRLTRLKSGNTYRFREDGSRFEQFTWGQTNPFGLAFDPLGNLYSSDCHSMPIYLLLRGGRYPGLGLGPDKLGFAPKMIDHSHGSTGICGPVYYAADHFPEAYRDCVFICNPVTGRVHYDRLKPVGSTLLVDTQPDLISSTDKWFRPVDLKLGPDGALYIADFCNPIIGHYEAPLNHPDRDRTHGRVWRVVWKGEDGQGPAPSPMPDLTKLSMDKLAAQLASPNLLVRTLATNYLVDAHAKAAPAAARKLIESSPSGPARAHALWVLERTAGLDDAVLQKAAADRDPLVRTHLMRVLAERAELNAAAAKLALAGLADENAFVRRAAVDALGRHPDGEFVEPLLSLWNATDVADTHLVHMIRLALREHVRSSTVVTGLLTRRFDDSSRQKLLEIASVAESETANPLLLYHAKAGTVSPLVIQQAAEQIARFGTADELARIVEMAPKWFADDPAAELKLLSAIVRGGQERGDKPFQNAKLRGWLQKLAPRLLAPANEFEPEWTWRAVKGQPPSENSFGPRERNSTDGERAVFLDSIVGGETKTGVLRSKAFKLPAKLTFWLCGHNGQPPSNEPPVNHVRLVLAESGKTIVRHDPPRSDTAQKVTWELKEHIGKQVRLEIVDAQRATGWAWIAIGRFDPPLLSVPASRSDTQSDNLFALVGGFQLVELAPQLAAVAADAHCPAPQRVAALDGLDTLKQGPSALAALMKIAANADEPAAVRARAARTLGNIDQPPAREALVKLLIQSPMELQRETAVALAASDAGVKQLLDTIAQGKASARLLTHPEVAERVNLYGSTEAKARVAKLSAELPPVNEEIAQRILAHRQSFSLDRTNVARGKELFTKHCAACHRIANVGGLVGPQLDGVGNRGLDRLLEDVFDPNRNVDIAFRTTLFITTDGRVITGLERPRDGKVIVVADPQGKEIRVPEDEVESSRRTNLSLMPATLAETIPRQDLHDLLGFLLLNRQPAAGEPQ